MSGGAASRLLRAVSGAAISAVLLLYVLRALWVHGSRLRGQTWHLRPGLTVLSFALLLAGYAVYLVLWRAMLADLGADVPLRVAFRVWFLSQLGKYVPGKVWSAVGRVVLLGRVGVGALAASMSTVYELLLLIVSGLLVAAAVLPLGRREALGASLGAIGSPDRLVLLVGVAGLVTLLVPGTWRAASRLASRFLGVGGGVRPLGPGRILGLTSGYAFSWLLVGAGFACLLAALHPVPASALPATAGAFVLSWVVGSLVFLAPAGLGVREGVLLVYLGYLVPQDVALVAVVVSRIWTILAEVAGVAVAGCLPGPGAHERP